MKNLIVCSMLCMSMCMLSQVGINSSTPNATLDIHQGVDSTAKDGVLLPVLDALPMVNSAVHDGLLVYINGSTSLESGYYLYNASTATWERLQRKTINTTVVQNYQYPDGFTSLQPVVLPNTTNTYTVPAGKNFYITNIMFPSGPSTQINGLPIAQGPFNFDSTQGFTSPLILGSGDILTVNHNINGFLVDAKVEPITVDATYTIPTGKLFVVLGYYRLGAPIGLNVDQGGAAIRIADDFGNNHAIAQSALHNTGLSLLLVFDENTVFGSAYGNFTFTTLNGYLIDKQ